jgi:hypothetical protein
VYSIINTTNNNSIYHCVTNLEPFDTVLPRQDYNIFDNKDEHSFRKFMDLVYQNNNGNLSYISNESNYEQMGKRPNEQDLDKQYVSLSKKAKELADYKRKPRYVKKAKMAWGKRRVKMVEYKTVPIGSIPLETAIKEAKVEETLGYRRKRIKIRKTK